MTNSPLNVSWLGKLSPEVFATAWEHAGMPPPWPDISTKKARQATLARIRQSTGPEFQRLNDLCRWAADLSDEHGINAIRLAAELMPDDFRSAFHNLNSSADRALWTIVHHRDIAQRADFILGGDRLRNGALRYANRYQANGIADLEPEDIDIGPLEEALRGIYAAHGQPTDRLRVEVIGRPEVDVGGERVIQITIRHALPTETQSDWSQTEIAELRYRPVRDTFLYYAPQSGRLDVLSERGGPAIRQALADAFATVTLAQQPPDEVEPFDVDLAWLLEERAFPTAPADGVRSVRILRLSLMNGIGHRVTLEATGEASIWDLEPIARELRETPFLADRAEIEFVFLPGIGADRPPARRAKMSTPNGVSFPRATPAQKAAMERLLEAWGLIRAPDHRAQRAA
jgi:hypothetical protein